MPKKRVVITKNREIYNKLNMLNFSTDVVLKNVQQKDIKKILNTINKHNNVLELENLGSYLLVKKKGPINFSIYFRAN